MQRLSASGALATSQEAVSAAGFWASTVVIMASAEGSSTAAVSLRGASPGETVLALESSTATAVHITAAQDIGTAAVVPAFKAGAGSDNSVLSPRDGSEASESTAYRWHPEPLIASAATPISATGTNSHSRRGNAAVTEGFTALSPAKRSKDTIQVGRWQPCTRFSVASISKDLTSETSVAGIAATSTPVRSWLTDAVLPMGAVGGDGPVWAVHRGKVQPEG